MYRSLIGQHVLVTGAGGYIGVPLIRILVENGARVLGVDIEKPRLVWEDIPSDLFTFMAVDMNTLSADLKGYTKSVGEEVLCMIHLAGLSNVDECNQNPLQAFSYNVGLTVKALDICREHGIERFIFPSTALIYGFQKDPTPVKEDFKENPENIYAASKLSAEKMILGYAKGYGINPIIGRLSNVYGVNDCRLDHNDANHPFPIKRNTILFDLLDQIHNRKDKIVLKDGSAIRDFIHIEDVVGALVMFVTMKNTSDQQVFNVSQSIGTSILKFAQTLCDINNISRDAITSLKPMYEKGPALVVDNSQLKAAGWRPVYSLEAGLRNVCNSLRKP
ncbi:NAD(P)-dependent oxidoreductase [Candidatus Parcubacteria bacterium]|nr:MAG: NAD(P)-dependent oxidoreductase [Candidatus Parcubacteria bacterium]